MVETKRFPVTLLDDILVNAEGRAMEIAPQEIYVDQNGSLIALADLKLVAIVTDESDSGE